MTIANAKPQLWQAAIERGLPKRYRWADLIRDVSNEFSSVGYGDKLNLTKITSGVTAVSYTHLRAHETPEHLVCRLLL